MKHKSIFGVVCSMAAIVCGGQVFGDCAATEQRSMPLGNGDADWMRGKVGIMVHWLYPTYGDTQRWEDGFDLEAFLADFERTGAEWLIFTAGQCKGVYCSPSDRLEAYCGPGHSTKRDILSEVAHGVKALGKHFIVYSASEVKKDGSYDCSMQRGLCWYTNSTDRTEFQRRWTEVLAEWARRLGGNVDGWWLDGAGTVFHPRGIDAPLWAKALRAGNPKAVWAFNMGVDDGSWPFGSHYTAGEVAEFRKISPEGVKPMPPPGVVRHTLFPIDGYWGAWWKWPTWTSASFQKARPELFDAEYMSRLYEKREFPTPICTEDELRACIERATGRGEAVTVNIGISPEGRLNPMSCDMVRNILKSRAMSESGLFVAGAAISVSKDSPRYFVAGGKSWIPIGCNICFDRNANSSERARELFDGWMTKFAANGGNFMRVWLSAPFVDVMPESACEFSDEATENLKWLVARAETLGIRLKFTFENFRRLGSRDDVDSARGIISFKNPAYAPFAQTMRDVFISPKCFDIYIAKASHVAKAVGKSDALVAVELWNEINSVSGFDFEDVGNWSERMFVELKKMFPGKMTLQNIGSFSGPHAFLLYDWLASFSESEFMQAHRYLDPGAELDVCRGPMDVLCADSVRELLDRRPDRPAILAEVGAVKANHAGPSELYPKDKQGMLLHDEIFAPFFAGSAGCGQPWHWDHQYIDGNNLWWHFSRFAEAVKGIDTEVEKFHPFHTETHRLRIWGIRGKHTTLLWCRDKANTWESELVRGEPPVLISGEKIPFKGPSKCYFPWENRWANIDNGNILPDFTRSIVVCIPNRSAE